MGSATVPGMGNGGSRVRRLLIAASLGVVLILVWGAAAFVQRAELLIGGLPQRIQAELAARGEPFVPLSGVPKALPLATVAVEDRSFWTNPGISLEGIARAALVDFASEAWVEGGSTITQQLIRDQLLGYQKTLSRKTTEMIYAVLATRRFSKQTILSLYLNEVNYGAGAFGIAAAAKTYFGLPPRALDFTQCTLLAGLPQYPYGYNPLLHPAAARARQRTVLGAMVAVGEITPAQARAAEGAPLGLLRAGRTAPAG